MLKKLLMLVAMLYASVVFAAVDVNQASAAELDSIKGIGPAISARIIEERKQGAFKDWDDLLKRVKGVGPKSAAGFSASGLTVNGANYAGAATKAATNPASDKKEAAKAATPAVPAVPAAPAKPTPAAAPAAPVAPASAAKK